jgi:hypothetical protein
MRTDILAGRIPLPFRNQALPIAAPNGDIWLVSHADGRLLRFSRAGMLLMDVALPETDIAPIRAAFFAANRAETRPGVLRGYYLSFSGLATTHSLWLLLAPPDSLPPTLLHLDSLGTIAERHVLRGAEGARRLILDSSGEGFFLTHPSEGLVLRLRRASPGAVNH